MPAVNLITILGPTACGKTRLAVAAARALNGEINRNDMFQKLNSAIHDFAKRQETWFRRMEKHGVPVIGLDAAADPLAQLLGIVRKHSTGGPS